MNDTNIGFIGGGNMASSLIGGLVQGTDAARPQVWVYDLDTEKLASLKHQFGVNIADNNEQLIANCDVIVLAIKPQVMQAVISPLATAVASKRNAPLLVSIAAGIPIAAMQRWLNADLPIVRVMPNTPSLIGAGASGLYANAQVGAAQRDNCEQLFNAVGITQWLASEAEIDDVIALSGSGPAYAMLFVQSLIDAAVAAGMDATTAKQLALQTVSGATELIKQSEQSISTLIDNVTSPGGTTERALNSFNEDGLTQIVANAYAAAKQRAAEMAAELDT